MEGYLYKRHGGQYISMSNFLNKYSQMILSWMAIS